MNLIEKLMTLDENALDAVETKEVEIKRLTKMFGEPFIVTVKSVTSEEYSRALGVMLDSNNSVDVSKLASSQAMLVLSGIVEPNLKDVELQRHFKCASPKELLFKLFRGSDLVKLADTITDLSGYGAESDEEIKN